MISQSRTFLVTLLICGALVGPILSETPKDVAEYVSKRSKGELQEPASSRDLQPSASSGPSLFAQSFALRPLQELLPNPRQLYGPNAGPKSSDNLGYGPVLGRADYNPPIYSGQGSFQKRGGSYTYGGVYPASGPGRGSPRGYHENSPNENQSEYDYYAEYDEYDSKKGGREGGYGGANYDYGDPVQNGGYSFSGQNHEGGDYGKENNNHAADGYGNYEDGPSSHYRSGQQGAANYEDDNFKFENFENFY